MQPHVDRARQRKENSEIDPGRSGRLPAVGGVPADLAAVLASFLGAAIGRQERPTRIDRVQSGTQKGVFRVWLRDRSLIVYVWSDAENLWPESTSVELERRHSRSG
jgi:hypothetical protein